MEDAERAEQEAAAEITGAQEVVDRTARARESVAAATPPPPARVLNVHSRSERPGDEAFLDKSVIFMASSPRRGIFGQAAGSGRGNGFSSPDVSQENVAASAGAPVGRTGMVQNAPQLLEGSAEGRPDP